MGFLDGKTEPASPKKREDARKRGQVARSREVVSVAVLLAGFAALKSGGAAMWETMSTTLAWFLSEAVRLPEGEALTQGLIRMFTSCALILAPVMAAIAAAAISSNVGQTGPMLVGEGLKVDFNKINPVSGLKRMVSAEALAELVKASAKIGVVGWIVYDWMRDRYLKLLELGWMEMPEALRESGLLMNQLINRTLGVLVVVAAADYAWQRFQHERSLMMTRDELKDEWKQQEGSPEMRGAIRRRQREISRRQLATVVPTADVVITNPTHYAVALKYDPAAQDAPQVVARGMRLTALRIRELAGEAGVPIVENPPLARSIYAACRTGDLIPPELYAAVAEVLAFVYRLRGRRLG